MTAKKKAKELYGKYFLKLEHGIDENGAWICMALNRGMAKRCALIACDEVLGYMGADRGTEFWVEVKNEIQKL